MREGMCLVHGLGIRSVFLVPNVNTFEEEKSLGSDTPSRMDFTLTSRRALLQSSRLNSNTQQTPGNKSGKSMSRLSERYFLLISGLSRVAKLCAGSTLIHTFLKMYIWSREFLKSRSLASGFTSSALAEEQIQMYPLGRAAPVKTELPQVTLLPIPQSSVCGGRIFRVGKV